MKYGTMSYLLVDEKVLMIKKFERENDPNSGFYTLPGGNLESDEKGGNLLGRLESVIRETKEETGITLINSKLCGTILFDNSERVFSNWKNPNDFFVCFFSSKYYTGELKKQSKEGIPLWVPETEMFSLPQNDGDKKVYQWLKSPRFFSGVIYHRGIDLDEEKTFVDFY